MGIFDLVVVEFALSPAEAAQIRVLVDALGLDLRDPGVVDSVRSVLREAGAAAFALDFRCEVWGLRVCYDPDTTAVDEGRVTLALRREFGVEKVEWFQMRGCGAVSAEFGFRCPESWTGAFPSALGRMIQHRVLGIVIKFSIRKCCASE